MSRPARGFTLVEVLVAVAVLAIALAATLETAGHHSQSVTQRRAQLFAHWAAEDVVARWQAAGRYPDPDTYRRELAMGPYSFTAEITVTPVAAGGVRQMAVVVHRPGDGAATGAQLHRLAAYLPKPPEGDETAGIDAAGLP